MTEYQYDNGKFCGYLLVDENNIIIKTMPVIKKFVSQPLENLISWTNQSFKYCKLAEIKN